MSVGAQIVSDTARIADAVERLSRELSDAPSLDDELRALATFASIALALLALFTTRRADRLSAEKEDGLKSFARDGWRLAVADGLLALATASALATMFPAFVDSLDVTDWFDRDHTLESMFSLVYLGFLGVFGWQLANLTTRIRA